jgi:hypothetical protein
VPFPFHLQELSNESDPASILMDFPFASFAPQLMTITSTMAVIETMMSSSQATPATLSIVPIKATNDDSGTMNTGTQILPSTSTPPTTIQTSLSTEFVPFAATTPASSLIESTAWTTNTAQPVTSGASSGAAATTGTAGVFTLVPSATDDFYTSGSLPDPAWQTSAPTQPASEVSTTATSTNGHNLKPGTLIAIIVPLIAGIILALALGCFFFRRARNRRQEQELFDKAEWLDPSYADRIRQQMMGLDPDKVARFSTLSDDGSVLAGNQSRISYVIGGNNEQNRSSRLWTTAEGSPMGRLSIPKRNSSLRRSMFATKNNHDSWWTGAGSMNESAIGLAIPLPREMSSSRSGSRNEALTGGQQEGLWQRTRSLSPPHYHIPEVSTPTAVSDDPDVSCNSAGSESTKVGTARPDKSQGHVKALPDIPDSSSQISELSELHDDLGKRTSFSTISQLEEHPLRPTNPTPENCGGDGCQDHEGTDIWDVDGPHKSRRGEHSSRGRFSWMRDAFGAKKR